MTTNGPVFLFSKRDPHFPPTETKFGWAPPRHLTLAIGFTFFVLSFNCAAEESTPPKPNILLIVSDDQRPDTIGALGNQHIATPHIDSLVKRGLSFTRATCANPICTPSRAELLTGRSGFRNGVLGFGKAIDPKLKTWPQAMRDAGYQTWYVGKWHNNGRPRTHGYDESLGLFAGGGGKWHKPQVDWKGLEITGYRGWIFQNDEGKKFPEKGVGLTPNISSHFADAAIEFIRRPRVASHKPFFLHVNFTAPHDPLLVPPDMAKQYDPSKLPVPANFATRHPFDHGNYEGRDEKMLSWPRTKDMVRKNLSVYYAVITHMDKQIGRILLALKRSDQLKSTVIIFTSDHGLALGSHGLMGKQNMYEHTINVPLVMTGPSIPQGKRCNAQCYLRDLYPTICEVVGAKAIGTVEGKSLVPVIQGKEDSVYSYVYGYFRDKQRMIRGNRWKLIHYPTIDRFQLFDLKQDVHEQNDRIGDKQYGHVITTLKTQLSRQFEDWK